MDKLIELINEHQKEIHWDYYLEVVAYRDWIFWSDWDCTSSVMDEIHLISKSYWFIKWLVENDKVDHWKLSNYIIDNKFFWDKIAELKEYESLLMLLAIEDKPIELLISILK